MRGGFESLHDEDGVHGVSRKIIITVTVTDTVCHALVYLHVRAAEVDGEAKNVSLEDGFAVLHVVGANHVIEADALGDLFSRDILRDVAVMCLAGVLCAIAYHLLGGLGCSELGHLDLAAISRSNGELVLQQGSQALRSVGVSLSRRADKPALDV